MSGKKETSTDRSSFEANRGLTHQEAASSINHKKEGLCAVVNNEKRSLTRGGLIEVLNASTVLPRQAKEKIDLIYGSANMALEEGLEAVKFNILDAIGIA